MDKHVAKSRNSISGEKHHSLPTGLRKAKTFLKDEYLHEIQTDDDQCYFFCRSKCFHSFKKNEKPHKLHLALCIVSGEVKYAHCGPVCAAGKSEFSTISWLLCLKCASTHCTTVKIQGNCKANLMRTHLQHALIPYKSGTNQE